MTKELTTNYICPNQNVDYKGYYALYDVMLQSELPEGSIVVSEIGNKKYIFQTEKQVDVFYADRVAAIKGTITLSVSGERLKFYPNIIGYFQIRDLRFPTQSELDQYEAISTI